MPCMWRKSCFFAKIAFAQIFGYTMLKDDLNNALKTAMKEGKREVVTVLRGINAAIKQREVDERINLNDAQVLAILQKQQKQRRESIAVFSANGREDLAQNETFELSVIEQFLPQMMNDEQISAIIHTLIKNGETNLGKLIGATKTQAQGLADPADIARLAKSALA